MVNFIVFFITGLICVCTLFAATILLPKAFPMILCIYFIGSASTLLYFVRSAQKDPSNKQLLINMQYVHIFNIIIASFFLVILGVLMIPKSPAPPSFAY